MQIYQNAGDVGPNFDQWGDCIDIAVKLAFHLKVNSEQGFENLMVVELGNDIGYIDPESVKQDLSVREVTNQKSIFEDLHVMIRNNSIRIKQSSDMGDSKKTTALLTTLESISKKITNNLEKNGCKHALKVFETREETLINNILIELDNKKNLDNIIINVISSTLQHPFDITVKDDIQLLGFEFLCIDQDIN